MTNATASIPAPATAISPARTCACCALPALTGDPRCVMHATIRDAKRIARQAATERRERRRAVSLGLRLAERGKLTPRPRHWDLVPPSPARLALNAMHGALQSLAERAVARSREFIPASAAESRAAIARHARRQLLGTGTVIAQDNNRRHARQVVAANVARIAAGEG